MDSIKSHLLLINTPKSLEYLKFINQKKHRNLLRYFEIDFQSVHVSYEETKGGLWRRTIIEG